MTDLIRSACLTSYPEIARSLGLHPFRLLASCGLDRRCLTDPDLKLPSKAFGRLLEASARAAKVDDFGLRLAETRSLSVLGPLGLLIREEATMRDALSSLMRYILLHNEAMYLGLEELPVVSWAIRRQPDDLANPLVRPRRGTLSTKRSQEVIVDESQPGSDHTTKPAHPSGRDRVVADRVARISVLVVLSGRERRRHQEYRQHNQQRPGQRGLSPHSKYIHIQI